MAAHGRRNARKGVGRLHSGCGQPKERANPPVRVSDRVSAVTRADRRLTPLSEMAVDGKTGRELTMLCASCVMASSRGNSSSNSVY